VVVPEVVPPGAVVVPEVVPPGAVVVPEVVPPGAVVVPEVVPPEVELLWAELGGAKGKVVKLRAKVPAKTNLDQLEGFIVKAYCNSKCLKSLLSVHHTNDTRLQNRASLDI
jgi:hypothetical protein